MFGYAITSGRDVSSVQHFPEFCGDFHSAVSTDTVWARMTRWRESWALSEHVRSERGESMVEVVVAVAIFGVASAALLAGTIAAAHRFGPDPAAAALRRALQREM